MKTILSKLKDAYSKDNYSKSGRSACVELLKSNSLTEKTNRRIYVF